MAMSALWRRRRYDLKAHGLQVRSLWKSENIFPFSFVFFFFVRRLQRVPATRKSALPLGKGKTREGVVMHMALQIVCTCVAE